MVKKKVVAAAAAAAAAASFIRLEVGVTIPVLQLMLFGRASGRWNVGSGLERKAMVE